MSFKVLCVCLQQVNTFFGIISILSATIFIQRCLAQNFLSHPHKWGFLIYFWNRFFCHRLHSTVGFSQPCKQFLNLHILKFILYLNAKSHVIQYCSIIYHSLTTLKTSFFLKTLTAISTTDLFIRFVLCLFQNVVIVKSCGTFRHFFTKTFWCGPFL